jgi:hypothetical protein
VLLFCVIPDIFLILPHLLINYGVYSAFYIGFQFPFCAVDMDWRRALVSASLLWYLLPVEGWEETSSGIN